MFELNKQLVYLVNAFQMKQEQPFGGVCQRTNVDFETYQKAAEVKQSGAYVSTFSQLKVSRRCQNKKKKILTRT